MDPFWMMQQQQQQWLGLLPPPLLFTSTGSTVPSQLLLSSQDSRSPSAAFSEEFVMYNWKTSNCIKVGLCGWHCNMHARPPGSSVHPVLPLYLTLFHALLQRFCHDWSVCPFVHPNEKCRRRSPKTYQYDAVVCPDAKNVRNVHAMQAAWLGAVVPTAHGSNRASALHPAALAAAVQSLCACATAPACCRPVGLER